jgi:hypothetical protein
VDTLSSVPLEMKSISEERKVGTRTMMTVVAVAVVAMMMMMMMMIATTMPMMLNEARKALVQRLSMHPVLHHSLVYATFRWTPYPHMRLDSVCLCFFYLNIFSFFAFSSTSSFLSFSSVRIVNFVVINKFNHCHRSIISLTIS